MKNILNQLEQERIRLQRELEAVTAAITAITAIRTYDSEFSEPQPKPKRTVSPELRARISATQSKRWAALRALEAKNETRS